MEQKTERETKIEKILANRQEGIIVLEDIHDPHNAMAVVRSADAFGFQKIYIIFEQEEYFNPRHLGKATSSSANKWIEFKTFRSTKECFEELKRDGYWIVGTVLDKEAKGLKESKLNDKLLAIALGNEHRGLSETAKEMADEKIYIPMKGMVESFNLSVTASLLMYEVNRRREEWGMKKYLLNNEERKRLEAEWKWKK